MRGPRWACAAGLLLPLVLAPLIASADPGPPAARIIGAALAEGRAFETAASLADRVGARMAGTPAADRAVSWAIAAMHEAGLEDIHTEPVKLNRWNRGEASVEVSSPISVTLRAVALGGSVGTKGGGLEAEVIEADSVEALRALGDRVRGKIVLYNKPMRRSPGFDAYGEVVPLRGRGAIEASRLGAVGALIRSVGTGAYRLPHTGATRYDDKVPAIPYAALAAEDADQLHRLASEGPVRVRMKLGCSRGPEVDSSNVVGQIRGLERPDEVVLIGAHLDSWDLGPGALDDAAGVAVVLETARILRALGLIPRRTLRVVLFMNEENGLSGARAYAETHAAELSKHVAAMESDAGAGRPLGFEATGGADSLARVAELARTLRTLGASEVRATDEAGADLIPLGVAGVPQIAPRQDMSGYFDWHHTAADTVDKIDRLDLSLDLAAFAVMAQGLLDAPALLPRVVTPNPFQ